MFHQFSSFYLNRDANSLGDQISLDEDNFDESIHGEDSDSESEGKHFSFTFNCNVTDYCSGNRCKHFDGQII